MSLVAGLNRGPLGHSTGRAKSTGLTPDVTYMQSERGQMMLAGASDSSDRSKDKLDQKVIYSSVPIDNYLLILLICIILFFFYP